MHLSNDLREFIKLLNSRDVDYLIVGAYSLAFHARPRFTGDLDILIRPSTPNARKLMQVLQEFGFTDSQINASDFTEPDQVIQLGRAPNRIDLLTSITGVTIGDAFSSKVSGDVDGLPVIFLSKELLIANKRAVGRPQDLADLDALET
ncbi:MAG TPA: nucleotidyltransferase [Chthoniobacterales bacterium]|nr:nucleotidyltransferase [Chthoniobacterales bacterium]